MIKLDGSSFNFAKNLTKYPSNLWQKQDIEASTGKTATQIADFIFKNKIKFKKFSKRVFLIIFYLIKNNFTKISNTET